MEISFQKIVLIIAIIFLILFLVLIGTSLSNSNNDLDWPPVVGNCPDYWVDLSGNGSKCFNSHRLGSCPNYIPTADDQKTMDFNHPIFTGSNASCAKYKWANHCKISWDGITYGSKDPCSKTTTTSS
jgi:hypothetical protein